MNILVTGAAGFIGSHFVDYLLSQYSEYNIFSLDKLTYAGNIDNLNDANQFKNHRFIQGDILDASLLEELFGHYGINAVVHFAAESHVDNSIADPEAFIQTNMVGTFRLLEVARKFWQCENTKLLETPSSLFRFHHISTDEVYGSLGSDGFFTEESNYQPNSPYSASKASSDMLVRSYHKTYGLNTVISNCSNNFGSRQHAEKLIPTVIKNALQEKTIPIYGKGTNVRDWIYVQDHCLALDKIFHQGTMGESYNVGGEYELDNLTLARDICTILDEILPRKNGHSYTDLIQFVSDRLGHDFRYAVDCSKIKKLGWEPDKNFSKHLTETINGYINK